MKRFKVHTITEKNCKWIFSKVKKFFEGREGFTEWHQFYGGMQKRMSTFHNNYKFSFNRPFNNEGLPFPFEYTPRDQIINTYYGDLFEFRTHEDDNRIPENYLFINMNDDEGFGLTIGDKVAFLGNRILIRTKGGVCNYEYCYQMFQIQRNLI